jgi:hypothetical protein
MIVLPLEVDKTPDKRISLMSPPLLFDPHPLNVSAKAAPIVTPSTGLFTNLLIPFSSL